MRKETYFLNTRYANHYDERNKTYTFELSEPIVNAVSMKLKHFYLNIQDISGILLSDVYSVNGYSVYKDISYNNTNQNRKIPKMTWDINTESKTFLSAEISYDTTDNNITLDASENETVVFNNTNNDITKALGFANRSYTVDSNHNIKSDKHIAISYLYNKDKYNINENLTIGNYKSISYYDDVNHFFLSVNDFCSSMNSNKINVTNNNVSDNILDKVERFNEHVIDANEGVSTTKLNHIYTIIPNNGNTRYYNQSSDIRTLKVKLLHETGTPLDLSKTDFNFTLEFEIE